MNKKLSYRADIDGLRALAVLLVIFFHAGFSWVKGGFIGVDVFFVISGYLITSSINKEMLTGNFSFRQFYLRRIRRIIPVLVFIILVVTIPACVFLFASDLEAYARTVLHTILSTNNFFMWIKTKSYFSQNSELVPLLHTWSLSVEEQFYIVWPPLLLLAHRFVEAKKQWVLMLFFIVLGIVLSVYLAHTYPMMAYFLLPARLFELSLGAGLAMIWDRLPALSKAINNILSVLGLSLILIPSVVVSSASTFPGFNALWPCLGAVFLIIAGKDSNQKGGVHTILETKPMVYIGLLSYSMYLWHWPILVFLKYLGFELTTLLAVGAIVLTIALSYLSWRYVEQPFRYTYKYDFKKTMRVVLLPSVAICAIIYAVLDAKNGFPERFPQLAEFNKNENFPNKLRKNCFDVFKVGNFEECNLGIKKDTLDGMLIGDSFANHSAAFLDVLATDAGLYLHDSAAGGYPLLYDLDEEGKPSRDEKYGNERLDYAKQFKNIFIAVNWEKFKTKESPNYQFLIKTMKELVSMKMNIFIIDALRYTTTMNLQKMKMQKANNLIAVTKQELLIPYYDRGQDYMVYELKKQIPTITVIDMNDVMCSTKTCDYEIDGTIVFRDHKHLNTLGAELIAKRFIEKGINPLKGLKLK